MNMSRSQKSLKVVEKFRAPAALYRPSDTRGNGWTVSAKPGMGGEVIIQDQQDADDPKSIVPVVRYQLRHGQDTMNCRIVEGLPIRRENAKTVLFKSASRNNGGVNVKTIFQLVFETTNDTDEFLMWWYEKNGSNKNRYPNSDIKTTPIKRKGTKCTPRKENTKSSASPEEASKPLVESTNQPTLKIGSNKNLENEEYVNIYSEPAAQSQNFMLAFD